MKIQFFAPLDRIAGSTYTLALLHPVTLGDVLRLLRTQVPGIESYIQFEKGDHHAQGVLAWRNHQLLTLTTMINPTDEIELIPMTAGG